jgi:hypothetical protein
MNSKPDRERRTQWLLAHQHTWLEYLFGPMAPSKKRLFNRMKKIGLYGPRSHWTDSGLDRTVMALQALIRPDSGPRMIVVKEEGGGWRVEKFADGWWEKIEGAP